MHRRLVVFFFLAVLLTSPAWAAQWSHPRGPNLNGTMDLPAGVSENRLGLEASWRKALGSGYSGVAVSDGKAVTMFSDGTSDFLAALDVTTGQVAWSYEIGATYKGHDGSHDGPLSSPVIHEDVVFGLGPFGKLFALQLGDGSEIWSVSLEQEFDAIAPEYGFTTTPLVEGKLLVVQTGADNGAIAGIDRTTGKKLWTVGSGKVEYQSPIVMDLGGRRQIVAIAGKSVLGIRPTDGRVLWEQSLGEEASTYAALLTPSQADHFLVGLGGESVLFRAADGEKPGVEEVFRTGELGNSYAAPVYKAGYFYGFKRQILTCVDATNGERVWRSRPPGGSGLILVGNQLVIAAADGYLVMAETTPKGYREIAREKVLDRAGYSWPSFADGRVFLRNLDGLAGATLVETGRTASAEVPVLETAPRSAFERWVREVQAAGKNSEKKAMVETFLAGQKRFPIVDGKFVHFIYVGEAEDVAIEGSMIDAEKSDPMHRLQGTDLYFRTYEVEERGRLDYRFQVDFGDAVTDPRNPRTVPALWDETGFSEVSLSGQAPPEFLVEPTAARGKLETMTFRSKLLENEREISVYLPHGYETSEEDYPLLLVTEGNEWLEKGKIVNALDNLLAGGATPVIAVLIPRANAWWREGGGATSMQFAQALAEELVPQVEEKYRALGTAEGRALMGVGGYASSLAYAALRYGNVFGKAALQGVMMEDHLEKPIFEQILRRRNSPTIHLFWHRYENRNQVHGYDAGQDSRRLADALKVGGYTVDAGELPDSYGWAGWRAQTANILAALFPTE